jgi:hypothetical protein
MSNVVAFAPRIESPDERELIDLFRACRNQALFLSTARELVAREQPPPLRDVSARIERLHNGKHRQFWCDVRRSYLSIGDGRSLGEVAETAAEWMVTLLRDRRYQAGPLRFVARRHERSHWVDFFIYCGDRYRAEMYGIDERYTEEWETLVIDGVVPVGGDQ